MKSAWKVAMVSAASIVLSLCVTGLVLGNGGPFVVKYPSGDPAAKGALARIGPDLKPARETRLRVMNEDLTVTFDNGAAGRGRAVAVPPRVDVSAAYTIQNPTAQAIKVDFGFPILRGIYVSPLSMLPRPDVSVRLGERGLPVRVISNSSIYGIIRASARRTIDRAVAADAGLAARVRAVRQAGEADRPAVRQTLASYLTQKRKWNERDAALMVAYARLDFGEVKGHPRDRAWWWDRGPGHQQLEQLASGNLGPLFAIGEQKATQFFAGLASRFDPDAGAGYETLFTAWGGDVREQSVDLRTGKVRPREVVVDAEAAHRDPTLYARLDYLDENAPISAADKASCKAILKNLPVTFTFAPMNLLYYNPALPPHATSLLTVSYSQYAYTDTRKPTSYQCAYVLHPASMWDHFGPINLEVAVPAGAPFRASVGCRLAATEERELPSRLTGLPKGTKARFDVYRATLKKKTGELFLAIAANASPQPAAKLRAAQQAAQQQGPR